MPAVADQRILQGTAATLDVTLYDQNGTPADAAGALTVQVAKADGTEVLPAGSATTNPAGTGTYQRSLTVAQTATLDTLTATWTDAGDGSTHVTKHEIVGGFLFTVTEARASDAVLADDVKYPTATILATRRQIEDDFERICDVALVPRYRRERIATNRGQVLLPTPLVRSIRSVRSYSDGDTYATLTASDIANLTINDLGLIVSSALPWGQDAVVEWEHGYDRPPGNIKTAALRYLRHRLFEPFTAIPERATSFSIDQGGTYRLDTASRWKIGIPDIDAELDRWSWRIPGVA